MPGFSIDTHRTERQKAVDDASELLASTPVFTLFTVLGSNRPNYPCPKCESLTFQLVPFYAESKHHFFLCTCCHPIPMSVLQAVCWAHDWPIGSEDAEEMVLFFAEF